MLLKEISLLRMNYKIWYFERQKLAQIASNQTMSINKPEDFMKKVDNEEERFNT